MYHDLICHMVHVLSETANHHHFLRSMSPSFEKLLHVSTSIPTSFVDICKDSTMDNQALIPYLLEWMKTQIKEGALSNTREWNWGFIASVGVIYLINFGVSHYTQSRILHKHQSQLVCSRCRASVLIKD